ncbi:MAG: hypothetical protein M3406_14960 [Chloroflexota bacterium]|nr:hypothetical protein [Chloroflexota bacterium]
MTPTHTDRIYRKLLGGERLTRDEDRHLASCADCQRAAADAARLDGRLREAAGFLALEPIPDEALSVEPMAPAVTRRSIATTVMAAAAMLAAVTVGLTVTQLRPLPGVQPSPSAAATVGESASPSPRPSASPSPTPTPSDPPPAVGSETDAHLVGPLSGCSDGEAGFSVFLPDGWYANRRIGDSPACRTVGRDVDGSQILDPEIYLNVQPEPPAFAAAEIEEHAEIRLVNGIVLQRYVVATPEQGALAASRSVTYVASLVEVDAGGPGGYLVAGTDATNDEGIAGLDAIMERLEVRQSLAADPEAVATASDLFTDRDVCLDPERGLGVVFPDAWWTNTAVDDLPACSYFAPQFFEISEPGTVPDEIDISITVLDGDYGSFNEIVGAETLTLMGRPVTRWELEDEGGRTYQYIVLLGEISELGPNLVASTHVGPESNYELARAVLDGMMERLTFAVPPPGAASQNPPIEATSISATDAMGEFRLDHVVEQDRYRAGQPIQANATLTYLGTDPSVTQWGSGTGIVGIRIRQLDGPIDPGGASTTDCIAYELTPDEPMRVQFGKSGSFADDDPLAEFYGAYFADPLLRLPPGRWEISAWASFTAGGDDCGANSSIYLTAPVEITVEP